MKLGIIGDDFTGSSDIGNTLAKGGMRVVQYVGIPDTAAPDDVEAGIVSLKSRTIPADQAVAQSLAAAEWLLEQGCTQLFFKICSTFDSTPDGNIGPVAEALAVRVGEERVVVCPAFPGTGRSVYQGHLFVGDMLLSESPLKDHPLTPMSDPDLRRWLGHQTRWPISHLPHAHVAKGATAAAEALMGLNSSMVIADAVSDSDLIALGQAVRHRKLIVGGSGLAIGLPQNFGATQASATWRGEDGPAIIVSGSCSAATRGQVEHYANQAPARHLTADLVMNGDIDAKALVDEAMEKDAPLLLYSSVEPAEVRAAQDRYGREATASAFETLFGAVAAEAASRGFKRIIVAGGETSGAVVQSLGSTSLEIGPEIAPGVPALRDTDRGVVVALKSGNFGGPNFFHDALRVLSK